MRLLLLLPVLCMMIMPVSYADDVQFHLITELGNTFPLLPPDRPRPANIIGEAAHLAIKNPPNGMFILTAPNHTTHHMAPIQTGIETTGFGSGSTIRYITGTQWSSGVDYTFRDQPFGTLQNRTMYHVLSMPLQANYTTHYTKYNTTQDSRFGLGSGTHNKLDIPQGTNGEYAIHMGSYQRVGLDFGAVTDDTVFYIYRGCHACESDVVIGLGNPNDRRSSLPNNSTIQVDHFRGWRDVSLACGLTETNSWSGSGSGVVSGTYTIPAPQHSKAGAYHTANRYDDLSILPQSHNHCTGQIYTKDNSDNRKHDICISSVTASATTTHTYPCTQTKTTDTYVHGIKAGTTTSTSSCSSVTRTSTGSCTLGSVASHTTETSQGYKFTVQCTGGAAPPPPSSSTIQQDTRTGGNGTVMTTTKTYSGVSSSSTDGVAGTSCTMHTNTPHLDLRSPMTLTSGLNIYQPYTTPAGYNLIVILDDTEHGGGSTERIQVFGSNVYHIAGPYDFHLRLPASGVLYDSHTHYGWVDAYHTLHTTHLAEMGYTIHGIMDGYNDGYGGHNTGSRLCHGNCFLGPAGVDGDKPKLRNIAATTNYTLASSGAIYDHINNKWYTIHNTDRVTATSLYITIPFAYDTGMDHVRLYGDTFDPQDQNPSFREDPHMLGGLPCHLEQSASYVAYANNITIHAGDAVHIPILPDKRYVAFLGGGECYWYDISALPSPLSGVSAGARTVPLYNGTILAGDLTSTVSGVVHVDVIFDVDAVWQSEAYGVWYGTGTGNTTWVVPPLHVNMTATARVNGAGGACNTAGVYCAAPIILNATSSEAGTYIHGPAPIHHVSYARAPGTVPAGTTFGAGMYGLPNGKCSGLETITHGTEGIIVRGIPNIRAGAGDTITLGFEVVVNTPKTIPHIVQLSNISGLCDIQTTKETAVYHVRTMTATLR